LQQQNSSGLCVEVNPETFIHSMLRNDKKIGCLTLGMIYW